MKFVFAFLVSLIFLVSCSLMQPRTARTTSQAFLKKSLQLRNSLAKRKLQKKFTKIFMHNIKIPEILPKRKQKHIEIWKKHFAKQNITVLENESLEETEILKINYFRKR